MLITIAASVASFVSAASFVLTGRSLGSTVQLYGLVTGVSWALTGVVNVVICGWMTWRCFHRHDFRAWFAEDISNRRTVVAVAIALAILDIDSLELLSSELFGMAALRAPMLERDVRVSQVTGILANLLRNVPSLVVQMLYVTREQGWTEVVTASIIASIISLVRSIMERSLLFCFLVSGADFTHSAAAVQPSPAPVKVGIELGSKKGVEP